MTARTYGRLLEIGLALAGQGETVILDAKYDRRVLCRAAVEGAVARGLSVRILHCVEPPEVLRQRLAARRGDISDAAADLLPQQIAGAEPFDESELPNVRTVNTEASDAALLSAVAADESA